jgi:hypothetical protein
MVANEVNKFGQISLSIGVENKRIWGNFLPFDFTSKSHLPRINLCQGYSTFFSKLFQNHPVCLMPDIH